MIGIGIGPPFQQAHKGVYVYDSFNRTQNALIGSADTGQIWTNVGAGGVFITVDGKARSSASGAGYVVPTPPNYSLEVTVKTISQDGLSGILLRTNGSYLATLRLVCSNDHWVFQRRDGSVTSLASLTPAASGDVLRVIVQGTKFECYVNGVWRASVDEAYNADYNFAGIYCGTSQVVEFDDFIIEVM